MMKINKSLFFYGLLNIACIPVTTHPLVLFVEISVGTILITLSIQNE